MAGVQSPREVLLVGSVGLETVEDVFRTAATEMGPTLRRIPDGEILVLEDGTVMNRFTRAQRAVFEASPAFEIDPDEAAAGRRIVRGPETGRRPQPPRFRIRPGTPDDALGIDDTGHARWALQAWEIFRRLRGDGVIAPGTRLQVAIPTPAAVLNAHLVTRDHPRAESVYRDALFREIARIAAVIPAADWALQWDVSTELAQWEGVRDAWFASDPAAIRDGVAERVVRLCGAAPPEVELGLHLCYGNFGRRHWKEPDDTANMVALFNRVQAGLPRAIAYVHMPVPIARDDDAYFAPLAGLDRRPGTVLYLGLVHDEDGEAGTRRRMAAAAKYAPDFGLATECGFSHRLADTLPALMRLHARLAAI